jgi:hypothetical protein
MTTKLGEAFFKAATLAAPLSNPAKPPVIE